MTMTMTPTAASLMMIRTQISDQTWVSTTSNPVASAASSLKCFLLAQFISLKWTGCVGVDQLCFNVTVLKVVKTNNFAKPCGFLWGLVKGNKSWQRKHTCIINSTYFVLLNVKLWLMGNLTSAIFKNASKWIEDTAAINGQTIFFCSFFFNSNWFSALGLLTVQTAIPMWHTHSLTTALWNKRPKDLDRSLWLWSLHGTLFIKALFLLRPPVDICTRRKTFQEGSICREQR